MAVGIQPEEFLVALQAKWDANSDLPTKVPGGLWLDKAPEEADATGYGVVKINPAEAQITADRNWIQDVAFDVEIYSAKSMDDTDRATIQTAMTTAFCAAGVSLSMTSGSKSAGAAWPVNSVAKVAESRRAGVNVIQTTGSFKIRTYGGF